MSPFLEFLYDNAFSIITATVALIALWQTHKQIRLSNKQYLFDKRLEAWLKVKKTIALYEENRPRLQEVENSDDALFANDLLFVFLTNASKMADASIAIDNLDNQDAKRKFLTVLEEMQDESEALRLLFAGVPSQYLADFLEAYKNTLMQMYQYQILLKHMTDNSKKWGWDLETTREKLNEKTYGTQLRETLRDLDDKFEKVKQLLENGDIQKQIQLL